MEIVEWESVKKLEVKKEKMKTKTKTLALLEIVVVLCSVFLVATLPGVVADQNRTAQKVSASEVTTAVSEDDFILEIYGNANEDDCIDMRDYTHTARIICWLEEETTFADANYDGRISVADMTQIGLIILGRESELTIIDTADRIVTVKKPVEWVIPFFRGMIETMRSIKAADKIIGVSSIVIEQKAFFPEFHDYPNVGFWTCPDYEVILDCDPDIVFLLASGSGYWETTMEEIQNKLEEIDPSITVIRFEGGLVHEGYVEEIMKLGYIFNKRKEANEFIDFYKGLHDKIEEKVEGLSEGDKPKVYIEDYQAYFTDGVGTGIHQAVLAAGGTNIFSDISGFSDVSAEEVITRNPEIIVSNVYEGGGYELNIDDTAELKSAREEIMSRPELQEVEAVKNEEVYIFTNIITSSGPRSGARHFVCLCYLAKWFHPDLFEDLNPKAVHQEYITEFQELNIDLDEKGVFVYPEPS